MSVMLLHPAFTHHVVFEEIGEMAGALSYVHAIVPVNISGLAYAINNFKEDVHTLLALYHKTISQRDFHMTTGSISEFWICSP